MILAFGMSGGCAVTLIHSGGYNVSEQDFERAANTLTPRAAVDLSCPDPQVRFSVVAVEAAVPTRPEQLRATGCGNAVVYVRMGRSTWVAGLPHPIAEPRPDR